MGEAERKHNFPRVVITEVRKGDRKNEMGWIDPTAAATPGEGDEAEAAKQKKEEDKEWARDEGQCVNIMAEFTHLILEGLLQLNH